ncbi:hypothetical protein LTR08_000044 [Meristemomyces frigidus]|nr:hypothetical protein LTR08_000044 [Meristemomyces frigidus]
MHFHDADARPLKNWIVKKLEDISDADSDVLADYVLALVKTDDPIPLARANCVENLKDFLGDSSEGFVSDAFHAIATRSYDPLRPAPRATAAVDQPPRRNGFEPPRQPNESRKRSFQEWEADAPQNGRIDSYESGDRPVKQPRRGGRGGFDPRGGRPAQQQGRHPGAPPPYTTQPLPGQMQFPPMPAPPPGMPQYDPNNPMAALLAMQQMMGLQLPPMPDAGSPSASNGFGPPRSGQRCRDYDTKGYCARGISCPYEHGENPYIVPQLNDEYDPNHATIFPTPTRTGLMDTSPMDRVRGNARARGRGSNRADRGDRGGPKRADFSHIGRNHDKSITTVVVEQIPEANFDEQSVRGFFGEFGEIEEVTMQPYKRLAIVKFGEFEAAQAAYNSPKSVFDNRFVKVYWYKAETLPRPPTNGNASSAAAETRRDVDIRMESDEPDIDIEELARKQEEAQRKHEEAKKLREEALKQRQELDEKLKAMEAERKEIADQLAKKTGKADTSMTNGIEEMERTKFMKAQLAMLEAEARGLGIDPDAMSTIDQSHNQPSTYSPTTYRGRGRGGYRGRAPRANGYYQPFSRGGWAGAGAGAARVKPTMSLDNRPKTVVVTFLDGEPYGAHEEALRQYFMFNSIETAHLSKHPDRGDCALVAFHQRFEGENFMATLANLRRQLGEVELGWHAGGGSVARTAAVDGEDDVGEVKIKMTTEPEAKEETARDMDTYDDMDRWG